MLDGKINTIVLFGDQLKFQLVAGAIAGFHIVRDWVRIP